MHIVAVAILAMTIFIGATAVIAFTVKNIRMNESEYEASGASDSEYHKEPGEIQLHQGAQSVTSGRLLGFDCIEHRQQLMVGDYIDIRIVFPNGMDYVVLSHKKMQGEYDGYILLEASPSEILKMAAAQVDKKRYQDTHIYAAKYINGNDTESICDYPVSSEIIRQYSWNPNIAYDTNSSNTIISYAEKRAELEKALETFVMR